jgi:prepilin-type N-terminal cleavage/methylation domain-containing protein
MIKKQFSKKRLHTNKISKTIAYYLQSRDQGFTIIESLVAILVVGILLVAIAPVLSLSVATRVQARRVELASQAARSYIDAVRTKIVTAPTGPTTATALSAFDAPTATGTLTCTANSICTAPPPPTGSSLYCVDLDNSGDCTNNSVADMIVQAFRPNNNDASQGYALGIRVYRADAFRSSTTLRKNTSTTTATQNPYTPGGGQRTAPLLEMTSEMSDTVPKYNDLCTRIGGCN